jgi:hypothetical protein
VIFEFGRVTFHAKSAILAGAGIPGESCVGVGVQAGAGRIGVKGEWAKCPDLDPE